jgi:threonylcarbamoyladenosine tRNA methylthiotransferase MtaB
VVEQIRKLSAEGYNEIVLTGVDVTSWGTDLPGQPTLGQLVGRILKLVPGLPRLRLSSIDAAEIDPDLFKLLETEPRLMPYLHLSLQAGDDMILKRMKRRHNRSDALKLVAEVRRVRPDTAFGADLIAGFPTETDEAFENTLKLVEEAGLAFLHVFPYSARPGTPAARMPPVKGLVIKDRARRLREAGQARPRTPPAAPGRPHALWPGRARRRRPRRGLHRDRASPAKPPRPDRRLHVTGHDGSRVIAELAA